MFNCLKILLLTVILVVFLACLSVMTAKGLKGDSTGRSNPVYPKDSLTSVYERAAQYILSQTGRPNKGYCLVFGAGEGRLAYKLAFHSDFKIIGVETDSSKVNSGRTILSKANLYGSRITLQEGSLANLDYRDYAASLVVSDSIIAEGACSGSAAEMFRMVRPDGGIALIGMALEWQEKSRNGDSSELGTSALAERTLGSPAVTCRKQSTRGLL